MTWTLLVFFAFVSGVNVEFSLKGFETLNICEEVGQDIVDAKRDGYEIHYRCEKE